MILLSSNERELLMNIEERPGLYVETVSYNRMISYLAGYQMGQSDQEWYHLWLGRTYPHLPFSLFGSYVYSYFEAPSDIKGGWTSLIVDRSAQDEMKSWSTFFEIFHNFDKLIIEGIQTISLAITQVDYGVRQSLSQSGIELREDLNRQDIMINIHKISQSYGYFITIHQGGNLIF